MTFKLGNLFSEMSSNQLSSRQQLSSIWDCGIIASLKSYDASVHWETQQQDAFEFLEVLFSLLRQEGYAMEGAGLLDFHFGELFVNQSDVVLKSFEMLPNVQLRTDYMNTVLSQTGRPFQAHYIDLDVGGATSLIECLDAHTRSLSNSITDRLYVDPIDDSNDPRFDINNRIYVEDKCNCFVSLPNVVIFRLKRFQRQMSGLDRKLDNRICFPLQVELNKYIFKQDLSFRVDQQGFPHAGVATKKFDLHFVVGHSGTCSAGHYRTLIHRPDGTWYEFSDALWTQFSSGRHAFYFGTGQRGWNAYLLGYVCRGTEDECLYTTQSGMPSSAAVDADKDIDDDGDIDML